jgi:hypothetical protein
LAIDPANYRHLYVGNDLGVFVSADYGETWVPWKEDMPTAALIMDLSISLSNRRIRAVTHGNGVYERALLPPDGLGISGRGAKGAIGLAARGNHLEFSLPRKARVAVEILSADGKRVRAFPGREYGAGAHRLAWDGRDASGHAVAPGTYLVRLRAGNAEKSAQWRWEGP